MTQELLKRLKPYLPLRIVLKVEEKSIFGFVEHSFATETSSERVRIFWSGNAVSILGKCVISAEEDAAYNSESRDLTVFDPLSPDCPVDIDWESWLKAFESSASDKFYKRNAPFTDRRSEVLS